MSVQLKKAYANDVEEIEAWWKEDKQKRLTRPYTAETVASLRNSIKVEYVSSIQAKKLWKTFAKHRDEKTPIMTLGTIDGAFSSQMARAGFECAYVSGGVSGINLVQEPGVDQADYPWDTVPGLVAKILKSQMFHDRRQRQYILALPEDKQAAYPEFDYLLPMIADGDMGFGGTTTILKFVRTFVESGVAMFHLDDLAIGFKRFTQGIGRTCVPTSEFLRRLTAARLQLDIMGAETLLMSRCDSYHCGFITSAIDPRDHKYIMGSTNPDIKPLIHYMNDARNAGKETADARLNYFKEANVMTFDEAVKAAATEEEFQKYSDLLESKKLASLTERKEFAAKATGGKDIYFDWDVSRNSYGHYLFKQCIDSVIDRATAALPLTDTTWGRMDVPIWPDIVKFHETMKKIVPDRIFGFGYTGKYDYLGNGWTQEKIDSFHHDLAKLGAVWQVQPIFAVQGVNLYTSQIAKMWKEEGISGYIREVMVKAAESKPLPADGVETAWSGSFLADKFMDTADASDVTIPLA